MKEYVLELMKFGRCLYSLFLCPVFLFSLEPFLVRLSSMQLHLKILSSASPVIMWWQIQWEIFGSHVTCSISNIWHMRLLPSWNVFSWLLECRFPPFLQTLLLSLVFFGNSFLFISKYLSTRVQFLDLLSALTFLVI